MICKQCGTHCPDQTRFCPGCGASIEYADAGTPSQQPEPPDPAPVEQPGFPPPQQGYAPPQPDYPPLQQGYTPPQPGYPPQQPGYPPPQPGYPPPQQGYAPPQPGYPPPQQGYPPVPQPGYPPVPQPGYPPPQQQTISRPSHPFNTLGGWLLFIVIVNAISVIYSIVQLVNLGSAISGFSALSRMGFSVPTGWLTFSLILIIISQLVVIAFLVMIILKNQYFLAAYHLAVLLDFTSALIIIIAMTSFVNRYSLNVPEFTTTMIGALVGSIVGLIIWTRYFTRSVRVRTYMGSDRYLRHSPLTKNAQSPVPADAPFGRPPQFATGYHPPAPGGYPPQPGAPGPGMYPPPVSPKVYCGKCGTEFIGDAQFCGKCGANRP